MNGYIRISEAEGGGGSYVYRGTFSDRGADGKGECIGDINIVRRQIDRSGIIKLNGFIERMPIKLSLIGGRATPLNTAGEIGSGC